MRFKHTANRIKRLLLVSAVLLILCSVVFMGASYAWFTDTDMQINRVLVGKLNIDLLMDKQENGTYVSIDNTTGDIFAEDYTIFSAANGNGTLWEPGVTRIVYLAVENEGDVELDYYFKLRIADLGLANALEYAIIDDAKAGDLDSITDWEELLAWQETAVTHGDLEALMAAGQEIVKYSDVFGNGPFSPIDPNQEVRIVGLAENGEPNGHLDEGEIDYFALAVHMKEDAGNDYMGDSIVFDVAVLGQQVYGYDGNGPADDDWLKN